MVAESSQKTKSLSVPVPPLIVFRFFSLTVASDYPPIFSWLSFEGASKYILKLRGSQGLVWLKEVPATGGTTVAYDGETLLQPGEDYILTVEIDDKKSYVNSQVNSEKQISQYVREGIKKIKQTDLPNQLKETLLAQLDDLLIDRNNILNIIEGVIRQGSNSEIICFLEDFLFQEYALILLAEAHTSDDILDALGVFASQLAAANITLAKYCELSGISQSSIKKLGKKGLELALFNKILDNRTVLQIKARASQADCRWWCHDHQYYCGEPCELCDHCEA